MARFIGFNERARRGLEWDMNTLADAVKIIPGPKSCNVVLERKWGIPTITDNDVSIVKGIELDDSYEKTSVELAKGVIKKIDDVAGDGTTIAIVVAQATVRKGLRNVTTGANPMALKKGIEVAVTVIVEELFGLAIDVEAKEQVVATASISAADPGVDEIIVEAMDKVGRENVITVEESNTFGLEFELAESIRFDKGYISLHSVTDAERMEAILDDPYALIVNSEISSLRDLPPMLEKVIQSGKSLLMVARDVEGEALTDLIINKLCGTFKPIAVRASGSDDRRKAVLGGIAILTGGQVAVEEIGLPLETVTLSLLGRARQVIVAKDGCTIVDSNGAQAQIEDRAAQIHREIENSDSDYDCEKLRERLAELVGDAVVIEVGATTGVELKECRHRIGGTIRNTKVAVEGGIVPGGGATPLQASKAAKVEGLDDNEMVGANIVFAAAQAPLRQITVNAGFENSVIAEKVADLPKDHGLDTATGEYIDMVTVRTINSAKVTRSALQNATSTMVLLLTTEAVIAGKSGKAPAAVGAPGMDGMGGMGGF